MFPNNRPERARRRADLKKRLRAKDRLLTPILRHLSEPELWLLAEVMGEGDQPLTTQFPGEGPWVSVVSHHSLDIEEEEMFSEFLNEQGLDRNLPLTVLETYYEQWEQERCGQ